MTYQQFLNGSYMRSIKKYPGYSINNAGRIYSNKTNKFLTLNRNKLVSLWINKKNVLVNPVKLLLETYPDVEFTKKHLNFYANRDLKPRGAYRFPIGRKPWRSIIGFNNDKITLGYFKTREEALEEFQKAFLMLRGYKPW